MMHARRKITGSLVLAVVLAGAAALIPGGIRLMGADVPGTARLIAFEPMPDVGGEA